LAQCRLQSHSRSGRACAQAAKIVLLLTSEVLGVVNAIILSNSAVQKLNEKLISLVLVAGQPPAQRQRAAEH
jgi:hypothetical protein